jgi:tripartite-type tricarboxylate transporter receptor subunit TctC
MANVRIVRVNYKGSGPSMMGLFTGEVQLMFAALGPIAPHVSHGKVRALAVTTPKKTRLMPGLPPIADTLPGYASEAVIGFFAPRKTAPAIVRYLNQEIVQALRATDPQILSNAGIEIVGNSPEEFTSFMKTEMTRMSQVIKSASFNN